MRADAGFGSGSGDNPHKKSQSQQSQPCSAEDGRQMHRWLFDVGSACGQVYSPVAGDDQPAGRAIKAPSSRHRTSSGASHFPGVMMASAAALALVGCRAAPLICCASRGHSSHQAAARTSRACSWTRRRHNAEPAPAARGTETEAFSRRTRQAAPPAQRCLRS